LIEEKSKLWKRLFTYFFSNFILFLKIFSAKRNVWHCYCCTFEERIFLKKLLAFFFMTILSWSLFIRYIFIA